MDEKCHWGLGQLGGSVGISGPLSGFLSGQVHHGAVDICLLDTACPPTKCESRRNFPKYQHWENWDPSVRFGLQLGGKGPDLTAWVLKRYLSWSQRSRRKVISKSV